MDKKTKRTTTLFPKTLRFMAIMGENVRLARKRRHWSTENLAQRAGISRTTLVSIEKGAASVSIGHYAAVLFALGLAEDLTRLAAEDTAGRTLQDMETLSPRTRKKAQI